MTEDYYKKCSMRKDGCDEMVAFIPVQYAEKGKWLKLRQDNGWLVFSASNRKYAKSEVDSFRDAYSTIRAVSGV